MDSTDFDKHKQKVKSTLEYWSSQYNQIEQDLEFFSGYQWDSDEISSRGNRPTLTVNKTKSFIKKISNSVRLNPFSINVTSSDMDAETEEAVAGVVRAIEHNSDASSAYTNALEHAAISGLGWLIVENEYEDDDSLEQVLKISSPTDPTKVYIDSNVENTSNSRFGFRYTFMDKDDAIETYGKDVCNNSFEISGVPDDQVVDLRFYEVISKDQMKYWYADGTSSFDQVQDQFPINSRKVLRRFVQITRYVGSLEVESTTLNIPFLPIVPVFGDRVYSNDLRFGGLVRDLRDVQRASNYIVSTETELIANAPKSPFIIADTQVEGYTKLWGKANSKPLSYLPYKAIPGVPQPSRADNTAQTQGLQTSYNSRATDFNAITGLFDSNMGDGTGLESGVAILAKSFNGESATADYIQSLANSIKQVGNIIVALLPEIYDTEREVDVLYQDGIEKETVYLQPVSNHKLAITVDSGPAYASKRNASISTLSTVTQMLPEDKRTSFLDILVENSDLIGKSKVMKRIAKLIPQEFMENAEQPIDPEVQATLEMAQQTISEKEQSLNMANQIINNLQQYLLAQEQKNEIDLQKAVLKAQTDLTIAQLKEDGLNDRKVAELESKFNELLAKFSTQESFKVLDAQLDSLKKEQSANVEIGKEVVKRTISLPQNVYPKEMI